MTRAYRSTDPATGVVAATFDQATDPEVEAALNQLAATEQRPLEERIALVRRIAARLTKNADELATIAQQEMGKPHDEGVGEVEFSASIFTYYADHAEKLLADQPIPSGSGKAVVQRVPIGTILGIMPWNFPYYQVARFAAPNLILGNPLLLKHAESVPRCALAMAEILSDAPYVNLFLTHDQVATVIADPRVAGVSLTGSERAGAAVAALAGQALKKCVLELGGSDPFIVLDTADVTELAKSAWEFRVYNAGQACNSNKRLIVHTDVYDEFVSALVATAGNAQPMALSSREAAEALAAQVDDAVAHGATLHTGGTLGPAAHYTPAVLTGVTPAMRAYTEELFGPVAVVYRVADEDEAVSLANASPYGLGGSVFSRDAARARRVAQRLDVGMANVNTPAGEGPELPFGGTKRSGFGRELGPLGIDEFANKRLLYVAD